MSTVVDILVGLALGAWVIFSVLYHARAAWYATEQGRNIMGVSVAIAGFLALALVARLWPDFDRRMFQLVVYAWLTWLGVQRTLQMLKLQRQTRAARKVVIAKLDESP